MPDSKHRRRSFLWLETLADRIAPALVNGDFSVTNTSDPGFGWTASGNVTVPNGQAVLAESPDANPQLTQTFTLPPGATALRFTIVRAGLVANADGTPPDAFQVALTDPTTGDPFIAPTSGLSNTNAFLNIQPDGSVFFGPTVRVPGVATSGQTTDLRLPITVTADLAVVPSESSATLAYDLFGFAPETSSVTFDDVRFLTGPEPPLLSFVLDPASDTGIPGDNLTRLTTVNLVVTTDPNQIVELDADGDGFDDGTATADVTGRAFISAPLNSGANVLRLRATNLQGTSNAEQTVTLDAVPPSLALVAPVVNSTVAADPGAVEIQWSDTGLDESTFGIDDLTVGGLDADRIENLGGGRVRYVYGEDGDRLPNGPVTVVIAADAVADRAGNLNAATTQMFTIRPNQPPVTTPDTYTTDAGRRLVVPSASGVLANDSDPDGDVLQAALVAQPANGTVTLSADGGFTYTPNAGFVGTDTFTYRTSDGTVQSDATAATVFVDAVVSPPTPLPPPPPPATPPTPPPTTPPLGLLTLLPDGGLLVPGVAGTPVPVRFVWTFRDADFDNELGVFHASGLGGQVGGVFPGQPGHAQVALTAGRPEVVFGAGSGAGMVRDLILTGGEVVYPYLVQNGTTAAALAGQVPVLFTIPAANPGGTQQVMFGSSFPGIADFAWEDSLLGADADFNDVVFQASLTPIPPVPTATAVPGVFALGSGPAVVRLPVADAEFNNEVGYFPVDEFGRVGGLLPGDPGYALAVLASPDRRVLFAAGLEAGAVTATDLPSAGRVAFYLVADGTSAEAAAGQKMVFFSTPGANPGGATAVLEVSPGVFAFEDIPIDGDGDFNDAVVAFGQA